MFSALDYYVPSSASVSMPMQPLRRGVVSPQPSLSPLRNNGLEAARQKHRERQRSEAAQQQRLMQDDFDDDYADATATAIASSAAAAVREAQQDLRSRSRPVTPNKVRLAHTRSPFAFDDDPSDTAFRGGAGASRRTIDSDGDTESVFVSPLPPSHSLKRFIHQEPQQREHMGHAEADAIPLSSRRKVRTLPSPSPPKAPASSAAPAGSVAVLKELVPFLSDGFACTEADAAALLAVVQSARVSAAYSNLQHAEAQLGADRLQTLEAQVASLSLRLERKDGELERLRGDVGDARGRYHALEQRFRGAQQAHAQRKEEGRKQLLCEEGKVAKLTLQCKNLQTECDRLRRMLHDSIGTPSVTATATAAAARR
jgi:hypothetical protein